LIAQAVTNLLDNAIKYTPKPGFVGLSLTSDDDWFEITVADSGPGIHKDDREHVLERFVRLENERNSPGNGLGLSLVHAVTRIHGGKLELGDNPNHDTGLRATIRFESDTSATRRPLTPTNNSGKEPQPINASESEGHDKKIDSAA